jgi:hypothetical protein
MVRLGHSDLNAPPGLHIESDGRQNLGVGDENSSNQIFNIVTMYIVK